MGCSRPCLILSTLALWLAAASLASSSSTSALSRKSMLSVETRDVLVSPNGTFICGFFQVGNNAFTFSIWYNPIKFTSNGSSLSPSRADVVWSANRDRPVNGRRSRALLQGRNLLVLIDGYDDSVVWTTAFATTANNYVQTPSYTRTAVERAELLDSGNMVLMDSDGNILWQSFSFPTDTLLPGQALTKKRRLTSSNSSSSLSSGSNVLMFDTDDVLRLKYDGPSAIYWPDSDYNKYLRPRPTPNLNNSRFAVLDPSGSFIASYRLKFAAWDHELPFNSVRRRLTLDPDGILRIYSRRTDASNNEENSGWYVSWQAMMDVCKVHGQCGRNGICTFGLEPTCTCPPGYSRTDPGNWKNGCKPNFTTAGGRSNNYFCYNDDNNRSYQFVEIQHTDFYGSDLDFFTDTSFEYCKSLCEKECNCKAFVYRKSGDGFCNTKSTLFNGYSSLASLSSAFIKLPTEFPRSFPNITFLVDSTLMAPREHLICDGITPITPVIEDFGPSSTNRSKWLYWYGFAAAFGLIELFFIATSAWFLYGRCAPNSSIRFSLQEAGRGGRYRYNQVMYDHFRTFSYQELKRATNNFKHLLGKGGSGEVYKGVLDDKRVVAVKRLHNAEKGLQGEEEFQAELSVIGRIYHMNLVRMWGFCMQSSRRILIYEFIENGSLDKALFSPNEYPNDTNSSNISNSDNDTSDNNTSSQKLLHQQNVLNWPRRFEIAMGTARGLAYLHHECLDWIIHCDIKPENILLDDDYHPKIADFGLVKLTQRDSPGSHLSQIRGTKGYMAPEWTSNVPITTKVDVYSYGVILLELLSGARLSSGLVAQRLTMCHHDTMGRRLELRSLIQSLKERLASAKDERLEEGKKPTSLSIIIEEFVDPRLHGDFSRREAETMMEIALLCTEEDRNKRPSMASVVQMLLNCCEIHNSSKYDY